MDNQLERPTEEAFALHPNLPTPSSATTTQQQKPSIRERENKYRIRSDQMLPLPFLLGLSPLSLTLARTLPECSSSTLRARIFCYTNYNLYTAKKAHCVQQQRRLK